MKSILMLLIAAIAITSCSKNSIRGSGSTITETRNVLAFTGVQLEGSAKVNITQGAQQKVEVSGCENLLPIYETKVQNGTLVLKFRNDYNIRNNNITVNITISDVSKVGINGSGELNIKNFTGNNFESLINGSGDINTENCTYDNVKFRVNGSGHISGQQLIAKQADVEINGSGKIDIKCSETLKATIRGSGEINYWGSPTVTVDVSGSGTVKKR